MVSDQLAHERSLAVVAEDARGLAGYALLGRLVDEAELLRLAVRPALRRHGLARRLVERALARLVAEHGCTAALLEVRADNAEAIAFYERTGWHREGRRRRYYADGVDALLYRRALGAP